MEIMDGYIDTRICKTRDGYGCGKEKPLIDFFLIERAFVESAIKKDTKNGKKII